MPIYFKRNKWTKEGKGRIGGYCLGRVIVDDCTDRNVYAAVNIKKSYESDEDFLYKVRELCSGKPVHKLLMTTNLFKTLWTYRKQFETVFKLFYKFECRMYQMVENEIMISYFRENLPCYASEDVISEEVVKKEENSMYDFYVTLIDDQGNIVETTRPETLSYGIPFDKIFSDEPKRFMQNVYKLEGDEVYFSDEAHPKLQQLGWVIGEAETSDCKKCFLVLRKEQQRLSSIDAAIKAAIGWYQSYEHGRKDIFLTEDVLIYLYAKRNQLEQIFEVSGVHCCISEILKDNYVSDKAPLRGNVLKNDCSIMLGTIDFSGEKNLWINSLYLVNEFGRIVRTNYPLTIKVNGY